ncbi:MAG: aminotransferase class V-fold PLP-dependent enzyme, partial [Candidatus Hodgkinia cicadicola]
MHNIIEIRKHFRSLSSYSRPLVYWDSASTALKLDLITKVVEWFDSKMCANPGRANYFTAISVEGLSIITRMNILKNVSNSLSKQCVFYKSATEAINAMILSRENCVGNILACVSDHNSVIGPAFKTKRFILNTLDEDCIPSVRNYLSLLNESIS